LEKSFGKTGKRPPSTTGVPLPIDEVTTQDGQNDDEENKLSWDSQEQAFINEPLLFMSMG
jgi:hypothetical protein